jgi:hypothetical protein
MFIPSLSWQSDLFNVNIETDHCLLPVPSALPRRVPILEPHHKSLRFWAVHHVRSKHDAKAARCERERDAQILESSEIRGAVHLNRMI